MFFPSPAWNCVKKFAIRCLIANNFCLVRFSVSRIKLSHLKDSLFSVVPFCLLLSGLYLHYYLSIHLCFSLQLFFCLYLCPSVCLYFHLSISLSDCLSICLSICPAVCKPILVSMSFTLLISMFVWLCVCFFNFVPGSIQ